MARNQSVAHPSETQLRTKQGELSPLQKPSRKADRPHPVEFSPATYIYIYIWIYTLEFYVKVVSAQVPGVSHSRHLRPKQTQHRRRAKTKASAEKRANRRKRMRAGDGGDTFLPRPLLSFRSRENRYHCFATFSIYCHNYVITNTTIAALQVMT